MGTGTRKWLKTPSKTYVEDLCCEVGMMGALVSSEKLIFERISRFCRDCEGAV